MSETTIEIRQSSPWVVDTILSGQEYCNLVRQEVNTKLQTPFKHNRKLNSEYTEEDTHR